MIGPGSKLAHYDIISALGKGGMGEVWRARDTKLERDVAIKTLPPELATDGDRLSRFKREAKSLAQLNHPHVASIYGFEQEADEHFLVLELIEGETLESRLLRGPLPREEALTIALGIAEAVEAAHERGIIHRDLKPANIKIAQDGTVKVLDFGLAKPFLVPGGQSAPTITHATEVGTLVGTPAYMSPEQVRGEEIDNRADIWAFGVILVEMLTGQSLFQSSTTTETLARVLAPGPVDPGLPADTPPLVARLVRRCLARRREDRLRHIGDAKLDLKEIIGGTAPLEVHASRAPGGKGPLIPWLIAAAAGAGLAAVISWASFGGPDAPPAPIERYQIATTQQLVRFGLSTPIIAISPDGSHVAYQTTDALLVYETAQGSARRFAPGGAGPFFSPDGESLAYFDNNDTLMSAPLKGGAPIKLADVQARALGGSWGRNGQIVFATNEGLYRIAADGGPVEPLISPDPARGELYFGWPEVLPGDRSVVFTILPVATGQDPLLAVLDLDTREYRRLGQSGRGAKYVAPGYLLFADGARLTAVDFDLASLSLGNGRVDLGYSTTPVAPNFVASKNGLLVYVPPIPPPKVTMTWVDPATGAEEPAGIEQIYGYPRISPDGTKVVGDRSNDGNRDLFIWDFSRSVETRFTTDPAEDLFALWSKDGNTVYFTSNREPLKVMALYSRPANGSQPARLLYSKPDTAVWSMALNADGGILAVEDGDFVSVRPADPPVATRVLSVDAGELNPVVSPNGQWLAYQSNETGQTEVSVRNLDDVDGEYFKISSSGGSHPLWSPDGNTLYYNGFDGTMYAVAIRYEPEFAPGEVTEAFPNRGYFTATTGPIRPNSGRSYDIAADGRFLLAKTLAPAEANTIQVVRHWTEALK